MKTLLRARRMPQARRVAAALFIAAAPMLYAVPAESMHYLSAWTALASGSGYYNMSMVWLGAGMSMGCYAIPLAVPVCIVMTAA